MRAAQSQASNAVNNAAGTAAGYGSDASSIGSTLTPFLTRELNNPGGISQQDQTAMLSSAEGGAGGLAGGLATMGAEREGATGNESGFSSNLDDIARQRMKATAGASSAIASKNADVKQQQQENAETGLRGLYGTNTGAQLQALGVENNSIGQEVNAGNSGWLQNMTGLISAIRGGGGGGGGGGQMPQGQGSGGDPFANMTIDTGEWYG